ncbi:MAG TPA: flagellar basal body rod protein FlgC [bacterium]|jgi:flagellar basal-body rod protein FlgC
MDITPLFSGMDTSASGLTAQRKRMNAIAENIANAETTHTKEGGPYRRQQTTLSCDRQFALDLDAQVHSNNKLSREHQSHMPGEDSERALSSFTGVKASVGKDMSQFREVYDPNNPDADENGVVKMPNVDIVEEMTDLISASRAFEANVTAFNATKGMMKKALEL